MNFEYLVGDLIASDEPVIAHGCNTRGAMGSGIARQIKDTYPTIDAIYRQRCERNEYVVGSVLPLWTGIPGQSRLVLNIATQDYPGADASTWAIFLAFANTAEWCFRHNINRVAIPRIGCGIGGMVWADVEVEICNAIECSSGPYMTIAVYDLPETP